MTDRLSKALSEQKDSTEQVHKFISGILGIPLNGKRQVEVQGRNAFVYVRLRNNQSEVIQAYNNQVSPSYNLPVLVERQGNRYVVTSVDTQRYGDNWSSFTPFLPRHGNTHSFDLESGGGGDIVWVQSRQITPLLAMPSGSDGGPNVIINPYTIKNADGTWKYIGNTGTQNISSYRPSSATGAIMALVYADSVSGNPYLLVGSGTVFSNAITGTSAVAPYIPSVTNPNHIPLAAVRLITGSSVLSWNNIYDVRQWLHVTPTGTGGGIASVPVQDEGVAKGSVTTFNFVGSPVDVTVSGSVARVFVTGSAGSAFVGDANSVVLTDGAGALDTMPWLKWGTSSEEFIEFGADEVKETNAGKIGYQTFDNYFDIIGAGTTGSTARTVQIYDDLRVSNTIDSRSMNIAADGFYNKAGVPHTHVGTVSLQDEGVPQGTGTTLNFVGTNVNASVSGSVINVSVSGGWELIQDIRLTEGSAFTFDFQNIPPTYKHLKIEFVGRSNRAGFGSDGAKISFNNITGSSYIGLIQWGAGQTEQATAGIPLIFTFTPAATSPANYFSNSEVTIFNYTDVNTYTAFQGRGMQIITNSAGNLYIYDSMGMFLSTGTAISRVTLHPELGTQFTQWSRASLYGL